LSSTKIAAHRSANEFQSQTETDYSQPKGFWQFCWRETQSILDGEIFSLPIPEILPPKTYYRDIRSPFKNFENAGRIAAQLTGKYVHGDYAAHLRAHASRATTSRSGGHYPHGSGEEAQVDCGSGPMVREPQSGKYRRMRLFVLTLGYSRKLVRLLTWRSSSRIWAELHEKGFRRL
jgi:hypothetical protein